MSFQDLNLDPDVLKAIEDAGFQTPTPIQEQAIPEILKGSDIRGCAQTGTGKTAAFLLPTLSRLASNPVGVGKGPRVLILAPTRELAMQVSQETIKYSRNLSRLRTVCVYGGAPYPVQKKQLARPYEVLVATPGRLMDFLEQGRINLSRVEVLILDEADRLLDMGFIDPIKEIAAETPDSRQTLMFSATMKGSVLGLSQALLNNPVDVSVKTEYVSNQNIEQHLHAIDNVKHKHRLLTHHLSDPTLNQAIIFTSTKFFANALMEKLVEEGYSAAALHGDMSQQKRTKTIGRLRQGKFQILVATDVAARGVDVQSISHVINFDLPSTAEDYVHRIGRTGRAGAMGKALSFAAHKDMRLVKEIEKFTGQKITPVVIPGMEPTAKADIRTKQFGKERRSYSNDRRPQWNKSSRGGPGARKPSQKRASTR